MIARRFIAASALAASLASSTAAAASTDTYPISDIGPAPTAGFRISDVGPAPTIGQDPHDDSDPSRLTPADLFKISEVSRR